MKRCRKLSGRERGQAVLLVVVGMSIFLFGALGLALDGAQMYAQQQMARSAADAGAQAGIMSIFRGTNATAPSPFATGTPPAAFTCTTSDGRTPCVYARLNGFGGTAADTVTVSFPTSVAGVSSFASTEVFAISVTVQRTLKTTLMRLLGPSTSTVRAVGVAGLIAGAPDCLTVLSPAGSGALTVNNNALLQLENCGITVNSSDPQAMIVGNNAEVEAASVQVTGNVVIKNNASVTPNPTIHAPPVADPFASVPPPTYTASPCIQNTVIGNNQTRTLNPGVYCGGITAANNVHITFTPGTYILLGGGLNISNNATLDGQNVSFYNTFDGTHPYAPISLRNNVIATLSATTSGSLKGILFFEDRNAPAGFTQSFENNSTQSVVGVLYFPRSAVSLSNNGSLGHLNMAIVANTVQIANNASLRVNVDLTEAGAPQKLGVALVK